MSQSNGTLNVRVTRIEQVTPEIKRFTLASTDGAHLTPFSGGSNVVDVYIGYLRRKLEEGGERRLIHTVRGVGYVLREE